MLVVSEGTDTNVEMFSDHPRTQKNEYNSTHNDRRRSTYDHICSMSANKSIKQQTLPKQFQNQKVNRNQWDDIVFKDRENNGLIIC